ncbi:MAG: M20 family metallopeptidase [Candidatus Lokiarchaeota archaeon]|nr:M20 family metallopeptidase [Candidatus Lokiarchaeota archaeon]
MREELIIDKIEQEKEEYIEFFRKLVQSDSINPPGNEKNVALIIDDFLKAIGVKTEIFSFGNNRANLVAYLNDSFDGRNLLYNGHMDTVPPGSEEDWKYSPLSALIKRNKLMFGRGTTDMKGGLAAMVIALKILKELKMEVAGNLILNAVADEETGGKFGTGWCVDNPLKEIKCDFAIIGEATGLNPLPKAILVGEKGHLQIKITTNGISGHSGMPAMSKNAIYMMSEIIEKLDKLEKYIPKTKPPIELDKLKRLVGVSFPSEEIFERIMKEQPDLDSVLQSLTSFSKALTMIKGGIKVNVIPDSCEAVLDVRLLPEQKSEPILMALKKLIEEDVGYVVKDQSNDTSSQIFVELQVITDSEGSYWSEWEESSDLKEFYELVEMVYEKKPFYFLLPASADAHFLRNKGYCPQTILFGPGRGRTAHAADEFIEILDFIRAIKVYAIFAYRFLTKK